MFGEGIVGSKGLLIPLVLVRYKYQCWTISSYLETVDKTEQECFLHSVAPSRSRETRLTTSRVATVRLSSQLPCDRVGAGAGICVGLHV